MIVNDVCRNCASLCDFSDYYLSQGGYIFIYVLTNQLVTYLLTHLLTYLLTYILTYLLS